MLPAFREDFDLSFSVICTHLFIDNTCYILSSAYASPIRYMLYDRDFANVNYKFQLVPVMNVFASGI